jgi:hypothetical protein
MFLARRMADNFFDFAEWRTNLNMTEAKCAGVLRGEMKLIEPKPVNRRGKKFDSVQDALLMFLETLTPFGFECFSFETWQHAIVLILSQYCALEFQDENFERTEGGGYNYGFSEENPDVWASCLSKKTYLYFKRLAENAAHE